MSALLTTRKRTSRGGGRSGTVHRLPTGRAVVGGLMVAMAMLAAIALTQRGGARHDTVLVAGRDLPAGRALTADDLAVVDVVVPADQLAGLVTGAEQLQGRTLAVPLHRGQLFSLGDIATVAGPDDVVSLRLPPDRALGGAIREGQRVTVFSTVDDCTRALVSDASVDAVSSGDGDLGGSDLIVTLRLDRADSVTDVIHGSQTGVVTLAQTSEAPSERCTTSRP